jgi:hypothetical protein
MDYSLNTAHHGLLSGGVVSDKAGHCIQSREDGGSQRWANAATDLPIWACEGDMVPGDGINQCTYSIAVINQCYCFAGTGRRDQAMGGEEVTLRSW